jgi:hypothetical protein
MLFYTSRKTLRVLYGLMLSLDKKNNNNIFISQNGGDKSLGRIVYGSFSLFFTLPPPPPPATRNVKKTNKYFFFFDNSPNNNNNKRQLGFSRC